MGRGLGGFLILCAAVGLAGALLACDSDDNAPRTLVITGPVHVYRTETPPAAYPGAGFIAELGPKDRVRVLDIRAGEGEGYKAVRVRLTDGREGWVFSGEGVEVREGR